MAKESQNVLIEKTISKLLVELENLRQAAIKRDAKKVEEIALRKEELLKQIRLLMQKEEKT